MWLNGNKEIFARCDCNNIHKSNTVLPFFFSALLRVFFLPGYLPNPPHQPPKRSSQLPAPPAHHPRASSTNLSFRKVFRNFSNQFPHNSLRTRAHKSAGFPAKTEQLSLSPGGDHPLSPSALVPALTLHHLFLKAPLKWRALHASR
jgi:hypothetical protein